MTNEKTGALLRIGRVDGATFHDVFEIVRNFLPKGDAVDLHDSYGAGDKCFLSDDGLSGFAVEQDGNIVSVFSLAEGGGFLKTVLPMIREAGGVKLDCYQFPGPTNLPDLYEKHFGFKRASSMAYDESFEPEDPAHERHGFGERHGMPRIVFMVADPGHAVEEKTFDGDYDGAVAWQNANLPARPRYSIVPINGRDMMVVPSPALTTREAQDESKVKTLLRQTVIGRAFSQLGEPADKLVKVDEDFLDEFWKSNDSEKLRRTREKLWRAKVDAANHLDELLATTPRGDPELPKHSNNPVKQGGTFYRSQTEFGVYDWRGVSVYPCQLLVFETKDGNRYVWDIIDIKKPTLAAKGALSNEVVAELEMAARGIGMPATLPQAPGSVKTGARPSVAPVPSAFDPGRLPASMKWGTLHGHDGNIVGLVAMSRLVGKRLTNDEISDLAQRLGVEMSAKEIRDKARNLADSEIGTLALGRAEASVRDAAAQGGQGADAIFGDAPSPDWTAEDYARCPPIRLGNASRPHRILRK